MTNETEIIKKNEKIQKILEDIFKRALNGLDVLYDFNNLNNKDFKECYGFTKQEIKGVVKK